MQARGEKTQDRIVRAFDKKLHGQRLREIFLILIEGPWTRLPIVRERPEMPAALGVDEVKTHGWEERRVTVLNRGIVRGEKPREHHEQMQSSERHEAGHQLVARSHRLRASTRIRGSA